MHGSNKHTFLRFIQQPCYMTAATQTCNKRSVFIPYLHRHTHTQLDSSTGIAARLQASQPRNHSSNPGKGKFMLQECSHVTQESSTEGRGAGGFSTLQAGGQCSENCHTFACFTATYTVNRMWENAFLRLIYTHTHTQDWVRQCAAPVLSLTVRIVSFPHELHRQITLDSHTNRTGLQLRPDHIIVDHFKHDFSGYNAVQQEQSGICGLRYDTVCHHDTGFSWFPCVYKQMLRWFPTFQVATTCFPCSPPDLNLVVTDFMFCLHVK